MRQYFLQHEGRDPDWSAMFAYLNCMTLYDDFSGEKRSMDIDFMVARSFCKVCNGLIMDCSLLKSNIECTRCRTRYQWQFQEESGFRSLMPPTGSTILQRCHDATGIA